VRRAQLAALGLCALAWAACGRASPPPEPRFPWELVRGMLDAAPEEAQGRLLERFPDSRREEGSFSRYQVLGSEVLDEVTLFRDIRSGRVLGGARGPDLGAPLGGRGGRRGPAGAAPSASARRGPLRAADDHGGGGPRASRRALSAGENFVPGARVEATAVARGARHARAQEEERDGSFSAAGAPAWAGVGLVGPSLGA
jgi:hypothetical protein